MSRVDIEVHNTNDHDITLPCRTLLGRLQLIKPVIPMEVKLAPTADSKESDSQFADDNVWVLGKEIPSLTPLPLKLI